MSLKEGNLVRDRTLLATLMWSMHLVINKRKKEESGLKWILFLCFKEGASDHSRAGEEGEKWALAAAPAAPVSFRVARFSASHPFCVSIRESL